MGKELVGYELSEKAASTVERGAPSQAPVYVTLGDLSPELLTPHADPGFVLAGQGEFLFVGLWDALTASSASFERIVKSHVRYLHDLQGGLFQQMQIPGSVLAKLVSTVANFPRDELLEVHSTPERIFGVPAPLIVRREGEPGAVQASDAAQADGPARDLTNIGSADGAAFGDDEGEADPVPPADEPPLSERILHALKHSATDFRTVTSLAKELGVDKYAMESELDKLSDKVRRPLGQEARYPDWYRLTDAGPTRQEKRARLKAIVTFSSMDDNF